MQAIRSRFFTILLSLLCAGFIMIALELVITGHTITGHTEDTQLVGVVASLLGVVLTAGALVVRGRRALALAALLLLLSLSGVTGTLQHYTAAASTEDADASTPPPLAPLSLAGLGVISALVIVGRPVARN